jgi:Zn-dependent protease with chaperone function
VPIVKATAHKSSVQSPEQLEHQSDFDRLIQKLENLSKQDPQQYRLRVALFALLGYAYILLMLVGLIGIMALIILAIFSGHGRGSALKAVVMLMFPIGWIVRSLWVKFPPPEGLMLNPQQVPQLFRLVNGLTTELQAPQFHRILLTEEFNAAVVQVPRLGVFGWDRNYLILGLPLMQSLSTEQLKAVLAHEIGHLSGNHSRFAGWIYRIRKTWMQIYEQFSQNDGNGSSVLFNRFLNWYWPAFDAYSFTLARMNEYEADRCSARLTGQQTAAEALISTEIKARYLDSIFWSDVQKQVQQQPDPPSNTYSNLLRFLHSSIAPDRGHEWLSQALAQKTNNADTHPCLTDRLAALGYLSHHTVLPDLEPAVTAAEELFGETLSHFAQHFDADWKNSVSTPWRQQYVQYQKIQQQLQSLEEKAQTQVLTEDEAWERAYHTLTLKNIETAMPLIYEVLAIQPNHAAANYTLGELLLAKKDEAGIAYLEKAIRQEFRWTIDGYGLIEQFFRQQGADPQAEDYRQRAIQHEQLLIEAESERATVTGSDRFKPHTLDKSEVTILKQQIAGYQRIREAYLVEKAVVHLPEERCCVLGIVHQRGVLAGEEADRQLLHSLVNNLQLPTQFHIVILNRRNLNQLRTQVCQVKNSKIFDR